MLLNKLIVFMTFLGVSYAYLKLARKYKIVDRPNHRSSHSEVTVKGGGIIFPISVLVWWFSTGFTNLWMVLGILLISVVSMIDDLYNISRKLRFGIQFLAISMAFYDLGVFDQESWWFLPVLYFVSLGIINAINFMDGINGITGLYGIVFFGSILAINKYLFVFDETLIYYIILSILAFLLFNLRKRALMFAGDIGSISIAYLIIYFLVQWYLISDNWTIILLLLIYGVDSFATLAHRLVRGENVALPHRTHLYQIFANQMKKDHVLIALVYAILQLVFNMFFYILPQSYPSSVFAGLILVVTGIIYLLIKIPLVKKYQIYEK